MSEQPTSSRRTFLARAGACGLGVASAPALLLVGCSDDPVPPSPSASLPQDPVRHWRDLATPEVLDFGRAVVVADPDAALHAVLRLIETPDSDDPSVASTALAAACDRDLAEGFVVEIASWTMPRTLAGLSAALLV